MLIAHDLGTSGNKASLHDVQGNLIAAVTVGYPTHYAADTTSEQNPQDWWTAVVAATRQLLATTGTAPGEILALCVSGQMMGLVTVDAAGAPVRPAMIWSDQRAKPQAAALSERFGDETAYRLTGHRLGATYPLPKLMWLRENEPAHYRRVAKVLMPKDYVNYRLTGALVTDHSDASSTDAYDLVGGQWSAELLDAADVEAGLWPEIVDSTTVLGTLSAPAAAELGLNPQTQVIAGGGDGPMASVGAGCVATDSAGYVCLGTSAWYSATSDAPVFDEARRSFTFRHIVPGLFAPTATTQTGAGSLHWAAQALGDLPAEIEELIEAAAEVEAAAEGLFFLPYLIGERSPWWDPDATGAFLGLRMHHRRPHLTRAVLEGVGYSLALCMAPLRVTATADPIDVIGGGASSEAWLGLLANIWRVPVRRRSVTTQANSLGAAVTALVGLGLADFSIANRLSAVDAEFAPGTASRSHAAHLSRFTDAYLALRPWFSPTQGRTV
jgi:xylulokinase